MFSGIERIIGGSGRSIEDEGFDGKKKDIIIQCRIKKKNVLLGVLYERK
jgi:hypothetical protein